MSRFRRPPQDPPSDDATPHTPHDEPLQQDDADDNIIEGEIESIDDDIIEAEVDAITDDMAADADDPYAASFAPPESSRERLSDLDAASPLERVAPHIPTPNESATPDTALTPYREAPHYTEGSQAQAEAAPASRRGLRLPRLLAWDAINPELLFLALGLVGGGVLWTLHNLGQTSAEVEAWWPGVPLAVGILWALGALAQRAASSFLASTVFIGISFSLLLDTQDLLSWQETLVGSVLMIVGLGIIARGLVLRQGATA